MYPARADASNDALEVVPQEVLDALARLVREVRFGSIEIIVHEGRITQIERREKMRFAPSPPPGAYSESVLRGPNPSFCRPVRRRRRHFRQTLK